MLGPDPYTIDSPSALVVSLVVFPRSVFGEGAKIVSKQLNE